MGQPKPAHYSQFGGSLREEFCRQVLPREKFTPCHSSRSFRLNFPSSKLELRVFLTRPPIAFQANSFAIFSLLSEARRYSLPRTDVFLLNELVVPRVPSFLPFFFSFLLSLSLSLSSARPLFILLYFVALFPVVGHRAFSRRYSIINPAE